MDPWEISAAYDIALALDAELCEGCPVEVRWTQTGYGYRARGVVSEVSAKGVQVTLSEEVQAVWGQPFGVGFVVRVPRPLSARWSPRNGVFPTHG